MSDDNNTEHTSPDHGWGTRKPADQPSDNRAVGIDKARKARGDTDSSGAPDSRDPIELRPGVNHEQYEEECEDHDEDPEVPREDRPGEGWPRGADGWPIPKHKLAGHDDEAGSKSTDDDQSGQSEAGEPEPNSSSPDTSDPDYKVGYGRPPRHSQFKKGQSGYPQGRKPKSKNANTLLAEYLDKTVTVRLRGEDMRMTNREVIIAQTIEKAKAGDTNARKFIMEHDRKQEAPDPFVTDHRDVEDLDQLLGRMPAPDAGNPFEDISAPNDDENGGDAGKGDGDGQSGTAGDEDSDNG